MTNRGRRAQRAIYATYTYRYVARLFAVAGASAALLAACAGHTASDEVDGLALKSSGQPPATACGDAGPPPTPIDAAPPPTPIDAAPPPPPPPPSDGGVSSPPSCFLTPGQYDCGCYGTTGGRSLAVQCHTGSCNCISMASPPPSFPRSDACETAAKVAQTFAACLRPGEPLPTGSDGFGGCYGAGTASCGCAERLGNDYAALDCHGGTCTCMRTPIQDHDMYPFGNSCDDEAHVEEAYRACQHQPFP